MALCSTTQEQNTDADRLIGTNAMSLREFFLAQLALLDSEEPAAEKYQKGKQGSIRGPFEYDGQKVALKTFNFRDRLNPAKAIEDAEREYRSLQSLPHPSIVRFIDFDPRTSQHVANLRMEWASTTLSKTGDAVDLEDIILQRDGRYSQGKKSYLPEEFIWHVLFHLSAALSLCHHGVELRTRQREEKIDIGDILAKLKNSPI
ncbi:hypothetical protein F4678DRAFT_436387 [Xylaria arbuscula]|nr:hypothetical protein F4678DRAFT_436387 [Xylaria arbuscula]